MVHWEPMADVTITDANFDTEVMKNDKPVLVDFWAVWCGPCQVQGPIVEEVARDMGGKAKVGKLNVDENPTVSQKFGIMSIPTLMIFKDGMVVKQFIGVQSKETLLGELNKLIN
jgi:thioredoxin 1